MISNAKTKMVKVDGTPMYYVELGQGQKNLIVLPGLGDGLKTVKGQALGLAFFFKRFAKSHRVFVFSRKEELEKGYTTKAMAEDLKAALDTLQIKSFSLMGVSQGGMVAQHFAIAYPQMVEKLVLAVSASRPSPTLQNAIGQWARSAKAGDHKALMIDTIEKSHSRKKLRGYRLAYPVLGHLGKPKSYNRFLIQAAACLTHDTYSALSSIVCPTLVIGGTDDRVVGPAASPEMAEMIPGSRLVLYEGLGHAAYEEAKGFDRTVLAFLNE